MTLEHVEQLLADRAEIRRLLQDRTRYRILGERATREATEAAIAEFVLEPLDLAKREIPGTSFLCDAVEGMFTCAASWRFADQPERAWNEVSVLPGTRTDSWHPAVKNRINTLCASLDVVLLRMFEDLREGVSVSVKNDAP